MKSDESEQPAGDAFARQLTALAAGMRAGGLPPARDLWPDIERAIDAHAAAGYAAPWRRRAFRLAPTAALAATVLVLVGLGLADRWHGPGVARPVPLATQAAPPVVPDAAPITGPVAMRQGLRAVEQALNELQTALERSPDDPDLSRLVLMIHHTRGRLFRLQADGGVRDALRGRS